ncbi:hypothetical protein [Desulfoluna sp.]|uniref:hypothetical protein n=1 Tax=Desulfoluna sp. TaxID=2045199 RepID=UPI00262573B4|nr:hypothetical protein [Desulfoluna sp.]
MDYLKVFETKLTKLNPEEDEFVLQVDDLIESIHQEHHEELIPTIFCFFEKFPLNDCGAPGTLVHFIEDYYPKYKQLLLDSLKREPAYNTILMVNRISNSNLSKEERQEYESVLFNVIEDGNISEELRNEAKHFIEYQSKRSR